MFDAVIENFIPSQYYCSQNIGTCFFPILLSVRKLYNVTILCLSFKNFYNGMEKNQFVLFNGIY